MYGKEFSFHLKNLWERYNLDYTKRNIKSKESAINKDAKK
jgi:hypothetical protein